MGRFMLGSTVVLLFPTRTLVFRSLVGAWPPRSAGGDGEESVG